MHCAKYVVVGDSARQLATASEDETGNRSYVWEARRHYIMTSDKLMSWWS
jgi:hypothetical protein